MADISSITLPSGGTYNFKDKDGRNTQNLIRPTGLRGLNDVTLQTLVNTTRANRLAFLPADQIIIEKTTDGGTTWVDAGVTDAVKRGLFAETRNAVYIPMINNARSPLCGIRITITAMKYDVPANTLETQKYNYWNSEYVNRTERYCQLKEMYFWVSSVNDSIGVKVERASGGSSTNWSTIFNDTNYYMTGWSGCDYIRFSQSTFGGGTHQTWNDWNYRITLMSRGTHGGTDDFATTSTTSQQSVMEIRAYGDTWWTKANEYMANDKMYTHDVDKNVTFPANVTATQFNGSLNGSASKVNNHTVNSDVPANAKFTDTTYSANTSKLVTTTVPNVTSVGSAPTLGTAIPADDITAWDAGSVPTLGTAIPADDITAWTTNTPTDFTISGEKLTITKGTAASLSYTAKSIPNVTSVGTKPSLSYTAKSIPNVTSVGSAPTLGIAITVATGSLSANGSGASVATGITVS